MELLSETSVKRYHMEWFEPIIQSEFAVIYFDVAKSNFDPLAKGNLHHLTFITVLLLVWKVGHMDPHNSLGD